MRDLDPAARLHVEHARAHQLHQRFADRRFRNAHRFSELADFEAMAGTKASLHQGEPQFLKHAGREVVAADKADGVIRHLRVCFQLNHGDRYLCTPCTSAGCLCKTQS